MTFLPFLLNWSRLPICSYNLFLFWPVPLKSVKKKSIYACILINKISLKKKKKKKYLCMYIDKQNQLKKKKKYTANKASQCLFCLTGRSYQYAHTLFFSTLACNTSNTKWLIYSLSQHLTRLANDFPAFFA